MKKMLRRAVAAVLTLLLLAGSAPRARAADRINILLIGLDRRPGLAGCRSDTVILCSCDPVSGKLDMISFLRDSYVSIPGYKPEKMNAAYAHGGFNLLDQTIEGMECKIDRVLAAQFDPTAIVGESHDLFKKFVKLMEER